MRGEWRAARGRVRARARESLSNRRPVRGVIKRSRARARARACVCVHAALQQRECANKIVRMAARIAR